MIAACGALIALVFLTQSEALPDSEDAARKHFERLYLDRAAIHGGYLEFTVMTDVDTRHRDMEGSARNYRLWFDMNGDRGRLDLTETRPRDPGNALTTRYAHEHGNHRIIDVDRADFSVREFTKDYLGGREPPGVLLRQGHLIDPRLLGVVGIEYGLLYRRKLSVLAPNDGEAALRVELVGEGGRKLSRITREYPNGKRYIYEFTGESILPSRIVTRFAQGSRGREPRPEVRVEVSSEIERWPNAQGERLEFPRKLESRRTSNGQLESLERIVVHKARFNVPVPASELSWKSLSPARGALLAHNDDTKWDPKAGMAIRWTGSRFETVRGEPIRDSSVLGSSENQGRVGGSLVRLASYGALGVGIVLAMVVAVLKVVQRWRGLA